MQGRPYFYAKVLQNHLTLETFLSTFKSDREFIKTPYVEFVSFAVRYLSPNFLSFLLEPRTRSIVSLASII